MAVPGIPPEQQAAALELVARQLALLDRTPFRKLLGEILECRPTRAAMTEFAQKHPDKWAQALSMVAGLAGFERGINIQVNTFNVREMSDAELIAEGLRLGLPPPDAPHRAPVTIEADGPPPVIVQPPLSGEPSRPTGTGKLEGG